MSLAKMRWAKRRRVRVAPLRPNALRPRAVPVEPQVRAAYRGVMNIGAFPRYQGGISIRLGGVMRVRSVEETQRGSEHRPLDNTSERASPTPVSEKRPYSPPQLKRLGSVTECAGKSGTASDGGPTQKRTPPG